MKAEVKDYILHCYENHDILIIRLKNICSNPKSCIGEITSKWYFFYLCLASFCSFPIFPRKIPPPHPFRQSCFRKFQIADILRTTQTQITKEVKVGFRFKHLLKRREVTVPVLTPTYPSGSHSGYVLLGQFRFNYSDTLANGLTFILFTHCELEND